MLRPSGLKPYEYRSGEEDRYLVFYDARHHARGDIHRFLSMPIADGFSGDFAVKTFATEEEAQDYVKSTYINSSGKFRYMTIRDYIDPRQQTMFRLSGVTTRELKRV